MDENSNLSLPAAAGSLPPGEEGSAAISQYLYRQIKEASAQFDITMHYVNQAVMTERERCAKIAHAGMPDQNNIQQRQMIKMLKPELSDSEISRTLNEFNRHCEACAEFIEMKIRSGE